MILGIQKKMPDDGNTSPDAMLLLVEQIADFYRFQRATGGSISAALKALSVTPYLYDHLDQYQLFTGVVVLTFRGWRP